MEWGGVCGRLNRWIYHTSGVWLQCTVLEKAKGFTRLSGCLQRWGCERGYIDAYVQVHT